MIEYFRRRKNIDGKFTVNGRRGCTKSRYYLLNNIVDEKKNNNKTKYWLEGGNNGDDTKKCSALGKLNRAYLSILDDAEEMIRYASKMRHKWFGRSTTVHPPKIKNKKHPGNSADMSGSSNQFFKDQKIPIEITTLSQANATEESVTNYDEEYYVTNDEDYDAEEDIEEDNENRDQENVTEISYITDSTPLSVSNSFATPSPFLPSPLPFTGSIRIPSKRMALFQAIVKKLENKKNAATPTINIAQHIHQVNRTTSRENATFKIDDEPSFMSIRSPTRKSFLSLQDFNEIFTHSVHSTTYDTSLISNGVIKERVSLEESVTTAGTTEIVEVEKLTKITSEGYSEPYKKLLTNIHGHSNEANAFVMTNLSLGMDSSSTRYESKKPSNKVSTTPTTLVFNSDYGDILIIAKPTHKNITDINTALPKEVKRSGLFNGSSLFVWARNMLHLNKGTNVTNNTSDAKNGIKKNNFDLIPFIIKAPTRLLSNGSENSVFINTTELYHKTNFSQITSPVKELIFIPNRNNLKKRKFEKKPPKNPQQRTSTITENERKISNLKKTSVTSTQFTGDSSLPPVSHRSFQKTDNSKRSPNEQNHINITVLENDKTFHIDFTTYSSYSGNDYIVTNNPIISIPEKCINESSVKKCSSSFQKKRAEKKEGESSSTTISRNYSSSNPPVLSYEGKRSIDGTKRTLCVLQKAVVSNATVEPFLPGVSTERQINIRKNDVMKRQLLDLDSNTKISADKFVHDREELVEVAKNKRFQRRKHLKTKALKSEGGMLPAKYKGPTKSSSCIVTCTNTVYEEEETEEVVTPLPIRTKCTCLKRNTSSRKYVELNQFTTCDESDWMQQNQYETSEHPLLHESEIEQTAWTKSLNTCDHIAHHTALVAHHKSTTGRHKVSSDTLGEYTLNVTHHEINITDVCEDVYEDITACAAAVRAMPSETTRFNEEVNKPGEVGSFEDTTRMRALIAGEKDEVGDQRVESTTLFIPRPPSLTSNRKCTCVCSCKLLLRASNIPRNRLKIGSKNLLFNYMTTPYFKKAKKVATKKKCTSLPTQNASRKKGITVVTGTTDYSASAHESSITSTVNQTASTLDKGRPRSSTAHNKATNSIDFTDTDETAPEFTSERPHDRTLSSTTQEEETDEPVSDYWDAETYGDLGAMTYRPTTWKMRVTDSGEVNTACITPESELILKIRNCTCSQGRLRNRVLKSSFHNIEETLKSHAAMSHQISKFVTSRKNKNKDSKRKNSTARLNRIKSYIQSKLKNIKNLNMTSTKYIDHKSTNTLWSLDDIYDAMNDINVESVNTLDDGEAYTTFGSKHYTYLCPLLPNEEKQMEPIRESISDHDSLGTVIQQSRLFEIQPIEVKSVNSVTSNMWGANVLRLASITDEGDIGDEGDKYQNAASIDLAKSNSLPKVIKEGNDVASVKVVIGKKRKKKIQNTTDKNYVRINFFNFEKKTVKKLQK